MKTIVNKFNRGEVSADALARDDVERVKNSCEEMTNFMPVRLGPMKFRPGTKYYGDAETPATGEDTYGDRALIPLIRSTGDSVLFEFNATTMRPLHNGLPIAVSADTEALTNETFATDTSGWSGTGSWDSQLSTAAIDYGENLYQTSGTVTANTWHTYLIDIGPTPLRLLVSTGSSTTSGDLFNQILYPGKTYLNFQSTSTTFTITFRSLDGEFGDGQPRAWINSVVSKTTGDIEFTVPDVDWNYVSYDSSADVMFMALGKDNAPKVIRRIGDGTPDVCTFTWEDYFHVNGPYMSLNSTNNKMDNITDLSGVSTITADAPVFASTDVGRLLRLITPDRVISNAFTAAGVGGDRLLFRGHGDEREVLVSISENFTGTVELQRESPIDSGTWETVRVYTDSSSDVVTDAFDGEIGHFRFEALTGFSGSIVATARAVGLQNNGETVIDSYNTTTSVQATYVERAMILGADTVYWQLGAWTDGTYPQGVTLYESRVVWVSENRIDTTVVDDYFNFDRELPGNDAAISRTIGFGPVDDIGWVESSNRMFLGMPTVDAMIRSSNFDEPLTPANTNIKPGKGKGSANRRAVPTNDVILHVSRDGRRMHALSHQVASDVHNNEDMMLMHPEICEDGIEQIVATEHPEHRAWVVTSAGELRVLLSEPGENIAAWARVDFGTGDKVKSLATIPASGEDELWIIVWRDSLGEHFIEKLSEFNQVKPFDSHVTYTSPGATATGLTHLEGETVGIWADSQDRGTATVASGQITLPSAGYTDVVVGLPYTADYKSNKLSSYDDSSTLGERKIVGKASLTMRNYAPGAVKVGRDFDHLHDIQNATAGALVTDYNEQEIGFNGQPLVDSRVCIRATGPATIMALTYTINEKSKRNDG